MNTIKDGGPAFPVQDTVHASGKVDYGFNGMSIRDWFAGQALAGMTANPDAPGSLARAAEIAYNYADAMLAERAKENKP